ncbi:hypothetical protein ACS0TY_011675 [Phlomoides rotata]
MVLGLKVNVVKSSLWGINVEHGIMENLGVEIGCEVGKTPFSYLGLNVSFNHRKISAWDNLVDRVKKKLEKWNGKHISFTGRITLVQAVLSAIPTPTRFFVGGGGGGVELKSKTPWVKWSEICKPKLAGGLRIRNLGMFNKTLVKKWIWRLANEHNRLWVKVLNSRYGGLVSMQEFARKVANGEECNVSSNWSGWWRDLVSLCSSGEGSEAGPMIRKLVGNGGGTDFWGEWWVGEQSLKCSFNRLFRISLQ